MKLLEVIPSVHASAGGTAEAVRQLVTARRESVSQQTVVSFDDDASLMVPVKHGKLVCLGQGIGRYGFKKSAVQAIRKLVAGHDLVTIHGLWQYHAYATRQALLGTGIPYVVFPHGMLDPYFNRGQILKKIKKNLYWSLCERLTVRDAAAVCFTAQDERDLARSAFPIYSAREDVCGFGIVEPPAAESEQLAAFHAAVPGLGGRRAILFLGRMHSKKGCDLLVEAFHAQEKNNPDLCLVMAGPDPDGVGEELRRRFPSKNILWPGPLAGAAKWGALRHAEAFALFSHQENFGIAVVEALACGTPVLITRPINIASQVVDSGGGMLANDTLPGAQRLLQQWCALDTEKKCNFRKSARSCYLTHFNLGTVIEHHLALYDRLIAGHQIPRFYSNHSRM